MSYTVKITYLGRTLETDRVGTPIASEFLPSGSYVDSNVMVNGHDTAEVYGKSIYATNVSGNGVSTVSEPYATTSIPMSTALAQFKLATVGTINEAGDREVEFDVDDYKEAFYYQDLGAQLADQGFKVVVTSASSDNFVAVTGITGIATSGTHGTNLTLSGTIAPSDATNQTIVWTVKTAGDTGATISGATLSTTAAGTVVVTATIADGSAVGTAYAQDTSITIA